MDVREQAGVLALVARADQPWSETAALLEEAGSAMRVVHGDLAGLDWFDPAEGAALGRRVGADLLDSYIELIESLSTQGTMLFTVLDRGYPANLRRAESRPPFLFMRGRFVSADDRCVAIVGTGAAPATEAGLELAREFGAGLAAQGLTVVGALDRGAGTAAVAAAIEAGGRAIAVSGAGINIPLAAELTSLVAERGALVSPVWPDSPPGLPGTLAREALVGGLALGAVVVEAGRADRPTRQALAYLGAEGPLCIPRQLTTSARWAARFAGHPGASVVDTPEDVATLLSTPAGQRPLGLAAG
jgi:DNA processing protein